MAPVLRPKHTLKGRSVVPLVKRLRQGGPVPALARLARDVDTEDMERADLLGAITKLMGEKQPSELWRMAGHSDDPTDDELRVILHYTITLAHELGQPLEAPTVQVTGFEIYISNNDTILIKVMIDEYKIDNSERRKGQ